MSNTRNKKIILLASTGLVTLSTMAVVLLGQNDVDFVTSKAAANTGRVVTVNENNRILDFYDSGKQYFSGAMFQLDDKQAYYYIHASQSQQDVSRNHNHCILAVWGHTSPVCEFTINYSIDDDYSFDKGGTSKIILAKFRHLNKIHITLDKGNGTDRYTSLKSYKDGDESGTFKVLADEDTYIKYEWVPEGDFLGSDEEVDFKPAEALGQSKAIWVTEMSFYYDC